MSGAPSVAQLRTLYQNTITASSRFSSYNFSQYFTRRTKLAFEPYLQAENGSKTTNTEELARFYKDKTEELEVIRRSAEVNRMYEGPKLVIEHALPITGKPGCCAFYKDVCLSYYFSCCSWWWRWSRSFTIDISHLYSLYLWVYFQIFVSYATVRVWSSRSIAPPNSHRVIPMITSRLTKVYDTPGVELGRASNRDETSSMIATEHQALRLSTPVEVKVDET